MRFFVDTNILLYAVNAGASEHPAARDALLGWLNGAIPWCIGWNTVYEFLRVVTHARVLPRPLRATQAMAFLEPILGSDLVTVLHPTDRHLALLRQTLDEVGRPAGNLFHDVRAAVLMREHGVTEVMTADLDFAKFPFVTVTDPTRPHSGR